MEAIPKHDYYRNREKLKAANNADMHRVMDDMEKTVELMDLEELERREIRRRQEEALRVIREREVLMKTEEAEKAATDDLRRKLSMLDSQFPRAPVGETTSKLAKQKQQQQQQQQTEEDVPPIYEDLPPPIPFSPVPPPTVESTTQPPPPSAPPSYNEITPAAAPSYDRIPLSRHRSEYKLKTNTNTSSTSYQQAQSMRSLPVEGGAHHVRSGMGDTLPVPIDETEDGGGSTASLSPLDPTPPPHQQQQPPPPPPPPKVSFTTLRTACTMEYNALLKTQTVQTFILSTYQGRINRPNLDSTNGCAVISPLVAAQHLASPGSGISDLAIEQIIDTVAPPILNRVRNKLGLGALALIIPSDVHDFLVDEGILKQDKFVGVCGGNLLDGLHVKDFLDMMESGGESDNDGSNGSEKMKKKVAVVAPNTTSTTNTSKVAQKVAATLFFHEHVVSIVKVVLSNGTSWFDIVDSLPRRQTGVMGATRTRCKDRDSLRTVLFWYASNKFSQTDVQYIDSNEWDDTMCDLDPRVFQAFAWQE